MKALTPVIGADWNIARHMLDGLERTKVLQITEKQRVAVLAAALLHDIAPGAPSIVLKAFSGENISLQDYLSLDDSTITELFKSCTKSSDIILSQLGDGILNRNLYKGIDLTGVPGNELANFVSMVRQALKEKGVDDQYYFVEDSAADTPYKPYDPDDEYPATEIYLETEDGGSKEISKTREVLKELKNRYTLLRYFFPEHLRGAIEEIRNKTLLKGAK